VYKERERWEHGGKMSGRGHRGRKDEARAGRCRRRGQWGCDRSARERECQRRVAWRTLLSPPPCTHMLSPRRHPNSRTTRGIRALIPVSRSLTNVQESPRSPVAREVRCRSPRDRNRTRGSCTCKRKCHRRGMRRGTLRKDAWHPLSRHRCPRKQRATYTQIQTHHARTRARKHTREQ